MAVRQYNGTVEYEGAVLATGERNYHDDSDFYAVVWNGEKVMSVDYDTTRGASSGSAVIDATDEVKALADDYLEEWYFKMLKRMDERDAATPAKGKVVRVVAGRKVPIGSEGEIFWAAERNFDPYNRPSGKCLKIGIALSDEMETVTKTRRDGSTYTIEGHKDVGWTYGKNVEVINPHEYLTDDADLRKAAKRARGNYRAINMYASSVAGMMVA